MAKLKVGSTYKYLGSYLENRFDMMGNPNPPPAGCLQVEYPEDIDGDVLTQFWEEVPGDKI